MQAAFFLTLRAIILKPFFIATRLLRHIVEQGQTVNQTAIERQSDQETNIQTDAQKVEETKWKID